MSTQQDIYVAGSENRLRMLNKDNYVPWSSRLLRYAKSKPNGKLIYNSIMNGPYVRRMIPEPEVKQMEADDQAIQIIIMGLPEDIYSTVDSCEIAQEIWGNQFRQYAGQNVRNLNGYNAVQNVGNSVVQNAVQNPGIQLQAEEFDFMAAVGDLEEIKEVNTNCILMANLEQVSTSAKVNVASEYGYYCLKLMLIEDFLYKIKTKLMLIEDINDAKYTKNLEKAAKERDELKLILEKLQNSSKSLNTLLESQVSDKDKTGLGYKAASPAVEGFVNLSEILEKQKNRPDKGYYAVVKPVWNNTRRLNHKNFANKFTHPHPKRGFVPQAVLMRSGKINTASASVTIAIKPVNTAGSKSTVNHPRLIGFVPQAVLMRSGKINTASASVTTAIRPVNTAGSKSTVNHPRLIVLDLEKRKNAQAKEIANLKKRVKKLERKRRSKTSRMNLLKIGTFRRRSLSEDDASKQRRNLKQRLRSSRSILIGIHKEIANLNNQLLKEKSTISSLQEEKKKLKSDFKIREDGLLDKQIQLENKIMELDNILVKMGQSIQAMHMLSPKPDSFYHTEQKMALVTSNSVPITKESKVVKNDNMIAPGMFRINSFKTSREDKFVPINQDKASVGTNSITISQPHVITKKHVNSDTNGLSFIEVDNTAKTKRPQPRSNKKNNISNDGFQTVGKKKKKAKSKSTNGGQFTGPSVKQNVRYEPKTPTSAPKKGATNVGIVSNSSSMLKNTDLDVAFRRNTYFVRNLEGVNLLKGNRTTNLYTFNLYEMASASPICLMAHATSTKS
nr:zinc knuckle CX2CX4HX4C [Tanacetum cinerariifolium]